MAMSSESHIKFAIGVRTKALNLQMLLNGAMNDSPTGKARRLSGSMSARTGRLILQVSTILVQLLGASNCTGNAQPRRLEVRYSLRIRCHKLWLKIRGKHQESDHDTLVSKPAKSSTSVRKTKMRSVLIYVRRILGWRKSSEKGTRLQEQAKISEIFAQYIDALGIGNLVIFVHGVGMVSILALLMQLAGIRGLPLFVIFLTGLASVGQLILYCCPLVRPGVKQLWYEAMSVGGISLLPQAMRVIFSPSVPKFGFTEIITGIFTLFMIILARYQRLPVKVLQFFGAASPWIPTILVLWAPCLRLWTSLWCPSNYSVAQVFTGLLILLTNCIQLPYFRLTGHTL